MYLSLSLSRFIYFNDSFSFSVSLSLFLSRTKACAVCVHSLVTSYECRVVRLILLLLPSHFLEVEHVQTLKYTMYTISTYWLKFGPILSCFGSSVVGRLNGQHECVSLCSSKTIQSKVFFRYKIGPFPATFSISFLLFNTALKISDDWIRTTDLWCRKQSLYQPSHIKCPSKVCS